MTHTRRFGAAVKKVYLKFFRRQLCEDCTTKLDRRFGIGYRIRHRISHSKKRAGHKLRAGIHHVRIRGKMRKVKVLSNGRWRFMKGH